MIIRNDSYIFSAFEDNTEIYSNGSLKIKISNKQTRTSISLSSGDIISSNKYLSFTSDGQGLTGIPFSWKGKLFMHRCSRYTKKAYITATDKKTKVYVYRSDNINSLYWSSEVNKNQIVSLDIPITHNYIFQSDDNVGVYVGGLPSSDCMPLFPCDNIDSKELFGCASNNGYINALYDDTEITEYSTNGVVSGPYVINKGEFRYVVNDAGSHFVGESIKIISNKPISAESQADGDGGEMTPFVGKTAFSRKFIIPEDERDYVKIISNKPANITVYDNSSQIIETLTLTGSSNNGIYHARLTGASTYENVIIESDKPVYALYDSDAGDETILMGY